MVLQFTVIDRVRQIYCRQHLEHAVGRKDKESRNEQNIDLLHARKGNSKKKSIPRNRHDKADIEQPDTVHEPSQYRIEQHHGKNLNRSTENIEHGITVEPGRTAKIIFKKVNHKIGCDVDRTVDQHNRHHNDHRLIILQKSAEHLANGRRLHIYR